MVSDNVQICIDEYQITSTFVLVKKILYKQNKHPQSKKYYFKICVT